MSSLFIRLSLGNVVVLQKEFSRPIEFGRQRDSDLPPFVVIPGVDADRIVIARSDEVTIGRQQLWIEGTENGQALVRNLSRHVEVTVSQTVPIPPLEQRVVELPCDLTILDRHIHVSIAVTEDLNELPSRTLRPRQQSAVTMNDPASLVLGGRTEELLRALHVVTETLHEAVSSDDFFQRAAQAVVELAGLDIGRVLSINDNRWTSHATFTSADQREVRSEPSRTVLDQVLKQHRTYWSNSASDDGIASLRQTRSVVAAPILNEADQVVGILYGEKFLDSLSQRGKLTKLEATLCEVIAGSVASGIARLHYKTQAIAMRAQFEQFFTRTLCEELEKNPDLLSGRDARVSVLFCDVRGFSRISERLSAARTFDWMNDVMGELSECVMQYNGVLVDYIGDELMAMWGTPANQPDHARQACLAGLAMLARMPELSQRWEAALGEPIRIGIGVNSGPVRAGNSGSRQKFKYGPLGHTVNLASRVQGATKYLRTPFLITGETLREMASTSLPTRRLCDVRVVNVHKPVQLHSVLDPTSPEATTIAASYERALLEFEAGRLQQCVALLAATLAQDPNDGPSIVLLSRATQAMLNDERFDPVWELPGK